MAAILGVSAVAVSLGRWQLRRLAAREANNAVQIHARNAPPLPLPGPLAPGDSGRRAVARGHFDTAARILLRGRVQDDAPGIYVVTPFVLDSGDQVLWIERGFVRSPDAATPPDNIPPPAPGEVTVTGWLTPAPLLADSGKPVIHGGATSWSRIERSTLERLRPHSLPMYLLLAGDSAGPGRLPTIPPPELTNGPHLSYAIQWFGIALAVLTFGVMILLRGDRPPPPDRAAP